MGHFLKIFFFLSFISEATFNILDSQEEISNLNYLYMDLYIGTSLKKQSFLLDTSIDFTTSICSPYSKITGVHQSNYYYANSNSIISCKDEKCFGYCDHNSHCIYDKVYDDELQLQSLITKQQIKFKVTDENPIEISLGCTLKENKFYYYNKADGVIGLSNTKNSFLNILYSSGKIQKRVFDVYFSNNGSYFTFNHSSIPADAIYVPMIDKEFYSISISSVVIGEKAPYNAKAYPAYINSGSQISYFPESLFNYIIYTIMNKTTENFNEKIERNDTYGYCLLYESIDGVNELINSLMQNIHFYFNDKSYDYIWKPEDYLYRIIDRKNKKYEACFGFSENSKNEKIILGSNWMKDHHIIFDIEKSQIGFSEQKGIDAPSQIEKQTLISNREEEIQTTKIEHTKIKDYNQIYLIIIAILISIIIILGIKIYKLSHQNKPIQAKQTISNEIAVELEKSPSNNKNISEYSKINNTSDI